MKKKKLSALIPHSGKNIIDPILESFPDLFSMLASDVTNNKDINSPKQEWELINATDSKYLLSNQHRLFLSSQKNESHFNRAFKIKSTMEKIIKVIAELDKDQIKLTSNSPDNFNEMKKNKQLFSQIINRSYFNDIYNKRIIAQDIMDRLSKYKSNTSAVYKYFKSLLESQNNSIANVIDPNSTSQSTNITTIFSVNKNVPKNFNEWIDQTNELRNNWCKFRENLFYRNKKNRPTKKVGEKNEIVIKIISYPKFMISMNPPNRRQVNKYLKKDDKFDYEVLNESLLNVIDSSNSPSYLKKMNNYSITDLRGNILVKNKTVSTPQMNKLTPGWQFQPINLNLKSNISNPAFYNDNGPLENRKFSLNHRILDVNSSLINYPTNYYSNKRKKIYNYFKKWNVTKSNPKYFDRNKTYKVINKTEAAFSRHKRSNDNSLPELDINVNTTNGKSIKNRKLKKGPNKINKKSNKSSVNKTVTEHSDLLDKNINELTRFNLGNNSKLPQSSEIFNVTSDEKTSIDSNLSICDSDCMHYRKRLHTLNEPTESVNSEQINFKESNQSISNTLKMVTPVVESEEVIKTEAQDDKKVNKKVLKQERKKKGQNKYANGNGKKGKKTSTTSSSTSVTTYLTSSTIKSITAPSSTEYFSNFSDDIKNTSNISSTQPSIFTTTVCSWWLFNWLWGCPMPDFIPVISEENTEKFIDEPELSRSNSTEINNWPIYGENKSSDIPDDNEITDENNLNFSVKLLAMKKNELIADDNLEFKVVITTQQPAFEDNCHDNQHFCDHNKCINEEKICNKISDCLDGSDENNCDYFNDLTNDISSRTLKSASFQNSKEKSADSLLVTNNDQRTLSCDKNNQFPCNDNTCIPMNLICDGTNNCDDGSDEDPELCNYYDYEGIKMLSIKVIWDLQYIFVCICTTCCKIIAFLKMYIRKQPRYFSTTFNFILRFKMKLKLEKTNNDYLYYFLSTILRSLYFNYFITIKVQYYYI